MTQDSKDRKRGLERLLNRMNLKLRPKLILVFLAVKVIPVVLLTFIALTQMTELGRTLREIAVSDSSKALNDSAVENIERMTTDTAKAVAEFLYRRDNDILLLAGMRQSDETYRLFAEARRSRLIRKEPWVLASDGMSWVPEDPYIFIEEGGKSTNPENEQNSGFHYRQPEFFLRDSVPLYDEIAFIDLEGNQVYKYVTPNSTKRNHPMNPAKLNIADRRNTFVKAEDYFEKLKQLRPGEIYVSDVIGAYVGTNYIGMYAPSIVQKAAGERGYDIEYAPEAQAYAGKENPNGERFEGIVRWATPVTDGTGRITGYVTMALNHDHIMEFVDYITPMNERYTELPDAFDGNYAFIWDYKCRNICHPRHHSIYGFDPETGDLQIPWLESSIYDAWQASGVEKWFDFVKSVDYPLFHEQSRSKRPAPALTKAGLVGLDGQYLNNAPQCIGWMNLTESGGSGSFYILWSGLWKLNTAGAIPYYTGQYAPSAANGYSKRGFGFVAIGAGMEDFTRPASETGERLTEAIDDSQLKSSAQLLSTTGIIILLIIGAAVGVASYLSNNILTILNGLSRFRAGERHFRLHSTVKDELGMLADSFDEMADSIVNSVNEPLSIIDMNNDIIYMNDRALSVVGKTLDEVVGHAYSEISIYRPGSPYCPITALREGREADVLHDEEGGHYFKGFAHYLLDKDEEKIGYIVVTNDVTEIEEARQKAEHANRAKSDFLSNMSHEMRTPLNAISGMTAIGKAAPDIKKKDYALRKIQDASTHLLGVINDILDMSKIEAKKFSLSITEFVFEKAIQRVVDVINFRVDEKRQHLSVHIDRTIPRTLVGDDQRLAQVLTNLLSNAVKFTPEEGSIHLEAKLTSEKNGICTLTITVTDTGIGISPEQRARLFTSFGQAESSTSRKYGGTGLGLVISKSIVEMMDGTIWIDSELGKGSTFGFTACLARGKEEGVRLLDPRQNWDDMRLLAVDDAPDVLLFFKEATEQLAISCDTVASGADALALIERNGPYDIYFLDWLMPGMDGLELAQRIKEARTDDAVVVMMSAADWSTAQERANEAGIDKFLPKPLFISSVADCINECLGLPNREQVPAKDVRNFSGHCILLAEDVEINREILLGLLEPTGLTIDCAVNGLEAVNAFVADPMKYDMIFMDVQMPEMDGYTATRGIRASEAARAQEIPIVAMTANVFKEDIAMCLEAGMNAHVGKPLAMDEVIHALDTYLRKA